MRMKVLAVLVICLATMSVASRADMAHLIVNGSFEATADHPYQGGDGFQTLGSGSEAIEGWRVEGAGVDWIHNYWKAAQGDYSIDMNALDPGILISQSFDTEIGKTYRVRFALGANPELPPNPKALNVTVTSGANTAEQSYSPWIDGRINWHYKTLDFTAAAAKSTLTFASGNYGACGPTVDDVSVVPVPVPAAIVLGAMGLGLVGWVKRRMA